MRNNEVIREDCRIPLIELQHLLEHVIPILPEIPKEVVFICSEMPRNDPGTVRQHHRDIKKSVSDNDEIPKIVVDFVFIVAPEDIAGSGSAFATLCTCPTCTLWHYIPSYRERFLGDTDWCPNHRSRYGWIKKPE